MIQTYNDIGTQLKQFESVWNGDGQLQKIYSSARYVAISLRSMGKTSYLYFGRGKGFEGFWLGDSQIPSPLRKKDQFLEYLRKHISGARLLGVQLDPADRIIYLSYQKFGRECRLGLFYNGRKLYFANNFFDQKTSRMKLFRSWVKGEELELSIEKCFEEVGKAPQNTSRKNQDIPTIKDLILQEMKEGVEESKTTVKESKFLKRKVGNIETDLEKTRRWPLLRDWLENQEDLEDLPEKFQIEGIKMRFKERSHYKRRDEAFERIKKLKRAEVIQEKRLKEALLSVQGQGKAKESEGVSSLELIRPVWTSEGAKTINETTTEEGGYKTWSDVGVEFGVGLSAKGNDQLRKVWAKKDDWWFHLEAVSSPHIIAKIPGGVVSLEILGKVAAGMKKYSKDAGEEINLIYTQVKNLKGITGKPGSVNYKKEKRVRLYVPDEA